MTKSALEDPFGHKINYLRISVTDRCNERCEYCMPHEAQEWLPRAEVLTYEEILRIVRVASEMGLSKIRVTGGEPLARRDVCGFLGELGKVPGIDSLGLSTNATLLDPPTVKLLKSARVSSVNVSLDTLDRKEYARLTGRDFLPRVLDGIDAALKAGLRVKLNAVLTHPMTKERMGRLLNFAAERELILRFIELMPVSTVDVLHEGRFVSLNQAKATAESVVGELAPDSQSHGHGPAVYYRAGNGRIVGFIGAMTDPHFCGRCNKLRLTCDGKLRPCLGSWLEFDIKTPMRNGATDADLASFLRDVVARKPKEHDFSGDWKPGRPMVAIGG